MSTPTKKISFVATGNEIIEGEILDTNGNYFARTLFDKGATIFQHLLVSDKISEISSALVYALSHSDAVIITGGCGPTSDDNTRFAISEVTGYPLEFDEKSWKFIEERFKKFKLNLVPANQRQALFPAGALIWPNLNGSAAACYLRWQNKHIFMLPGPPKECRPIFEANLLPVMESEGFFEKKMMFRWLTLGLSESEISEKIDALAQPFGYETGFRWHYPYLEIKVWAEKEEADPAVIETIHELLTPFCVSRNRQEADAVLIESLKGKHEKFAFINKAVEGDLFIDPRLQALNKGDPTQSDWVCLAQATPLITPVLKHEGTVTLSFSVFFQKKSVYQHELTIPFRGPEIAQYARAYMAWQLTVFLKLE